MELFEKQHLQGLKVQNLQGFKNSEIIIMIRSIDDNLPGLLTNNFEALTVMKYYMDIYNIISIKPTYKRLLLPKDFLFCPLRLLPFSLGHHYSSGLKLQKKR